MATTTTKQLAELAGAKLVGKGTTEITDAQPLKDAIAGNITLLDDANRRENLANCKASAVVTPCELDISNIDQLIVDDVHAAFMKIVAVFRRSATTAPAGISAHAIVDPSARIADDCVIGPGCIIGADVSIAAGSRLVSGVTVLDGCTIGQQVLIYPGVVLYENTILEDRVIIHGGSVVGSIGFGYRLVEGTHQPTGQLGYVHIESDVEVGAAVTIDRGTYGATRIGCGTKIDNQVQIAHNCKIGKHNLLCSQVGIAGSCSTGDYVVLAGQVGIADHIDLADGVIVGAQAGVMHNCEAGNVYLGTPANRLKEQMQIFAMWRKLPEMRRTIKVIEKQIAALQLKAEPKAEPKSESQSKAA